ncbi:MAG TPA: hypothetical protein VEB59_16185 [Gemmatimonadales bacterium]|nr:hypothetical protein [Gemmatimonadales bacterium]
MRLVAYYLVLLAMAVWAGWTGFEWAAAVRRSDFATELRITRAWPAGKRQMELRERVKAAQEAERRRITSRMVLQGGMGLIVLHLVSLGLKERDPA